MYLFFYHPVRDQIFIENKFNPNNRIPLGMKYNSIKYSKGGDKLYPPFDAAKI